jgi:DNA-binding response OmpR family regulator
MDAAGRRDLSAQLGGQGYSLQWVRHAEEAMSVVIEKPVDMLIVSVHSDFDLIAALKADHRLRGIPILGLTGATLDSDRIRLLDEFGIPLLPRPWQESYLLDCMEDVFRHAVHANTHPPGNESHAVRPPKGRGKGATP